MSDEYELVPEKEVEDLKRDIEEIKRNPLGSTASGRDIVKAMKDLTDSVNHLIALFRDAADAMKLEEKESEAIGKKLAPMLDKLNTLIDQNEKIARGIVGVADIVKEDVYKKQSMPDKTFYKPMNEPNSELPQFDIPKPFDMPEIPPSAPYRQEQGSQIRPQPEMRSASNMDMPPPAAPKPSGRRIFGF
ncbi:MAG: hypothetical protein NT001_02350 [Candidatus Woesearchaeota archaeon]|nr:hypothetical protein [Candidatus Woesearchaeota archaeon]